LGKAVVILSGGMDSSLCAYIAKQENDDLVALHFNYAQRTETKELQAFRDITSSLGIKSKYEIDLGFFSKIDTSSLVNKNLEIRTDGVQADTPNTYVPYRNGIFISIATAILEKESADTLYIGVVSEDSSGYPDCRGEFIKSIENSINLGTKDKTDIKIKAPLINLSKKDIVQKSIELGVPLELTWSCYKENDIACGVCDSCRLRLNGFRLADKKDTILYQNVGA
jgi:7-cyano-7-deazaguanine synthase